MKVFRYGRITLPSYEYSLGFLFPGQKKYCCTIFGYGEVIFLMCFITTSTLSHYQTVNCSVTLKQCLQFVIGLINIYYLHLKPDIISLFGEILLNRNAMWPYLYGGHNQTLPTMGKKQHTLLIMCIHFVNGISLLRPLKTPLGQGH